MVAAWGAALVLAYLAHLGSPLRLTNDAVVYLLQSVGGHAEELALRRSYPPGYSAVLGAMRSLGLNMPAGVIALNLAGLVAGVVGAHALFRRAFGMSRQEAGVACAVLLSSFALVKYAPVPMADVLSAAMGWGVLALAVWAEQEPRRRLATLGAALVLIVPCVLVRTANVALLAPVLAVGWAEVKRGRLVALGALAVAVVATGVLLLDSILGYAAEWVANYSRYGFGSVRWNVEAKLVGLAEVGTNLPRWALGGEPMRLVLMGGGLAVGGALGYGWWRSRKGSVAANAFAAASLLMLAAWPGRDERFWIPMLPLLVGYGWVFLRAMPAPQRVVPAAAAWFGLSGAAALAYSLYLSVPADAFPERYGRGRFVEPFSAFCDGGEVAYERAHRARARYEVWVVLLTDQEALIPAFSPCEAGDPPRRSLPSVPTP